MPLAWFDKYIQRYAKEQSVLAFQNGSPGRSCHSPFRRVPRTRRDTQASGGGMCVLHGTPGTFWVDLTGARYDYCRGDPGDAYYSMLRKPSPPGVSEDGGSEHSREIPPPIHPHRQSLQFDPAADPTDDHTDCRSRSIGYASGRVEMIPESLFFCNWSCVVLSRSEESISRGKRLKVTGTSPN